MSAAGPTGGNAGASAVPSLFEWAGGAEALARLTERFYARVRTDALLAPIFEQMSSAHPAFVAQFLGEVLGGPSRYSAERGGHREMLRHHLGRQLTEAQRRRWMELLLEWGSRLAVINSQPGASVDVDAPMPTWGWGVPGGPYRP